MFKVEEKGLTALTALFFLAFSFLLLALFLPVIVAGIITLVFFIPILITMLEE